MLNTFQKKKRFSYEYTDKNCLDHWNLRFHHENFSNRSRNHPLKYSMGLTGLFGTAEVSINYFLKDNQITLFWLILFINTVI